MSDTMEPTRIGDATLYLGDALEVMRSLPEGSVDAVVTDPPYGLEFMGRDWDAPWKGDWQAGGGMAKHLRVFQGWCEAWASALLPAMRPGAYLLAFGGTRTYHRLVSGIEDAGFEIHDTITWLYGQGFPKHRSKLKPAHEPIVVARKPAATATPLRIDECRIETGTRRLIDATANINASDWGTFQGSRSAGTTTLGRWPANLVLDEAAAAMLDEQSGILSTHPGTTRTDSGEGGYGRLPARKAGTVLSRGDTGGASRFFYCPKASRSDRGPDNTHPTVKPTDLLRWLIRLIAAPGSVVLDPFMGSGSTGKAAAMEGVRFIGIERDPAYHSIACNRVAAEADKTALLEPARP